MCISYLHSFYHFDGVIISFKVWMINRNSIEHRFRVTPTDPLGKGWEVVLSVSLLLMQNERLGVFEMVGVVS